MQTMYKESSRRVVSTKTLLNQFMQETESIISYNQFRLQINKVTKVQNIKTEGYFERIQNDT